MHPRDTAAVAPDRPAIVMAGSGRVLSYGELVRQSDRCAEFLRSLGLGIGDSIAICLENRLEYFIFAWAAFNSGIYFTPVSSRLKRDEIAYIVRNCDAQVVFTSVALRDEVSDLPGMIPEVRSWLMLDGVASGFERCEAVLARFSGDERIMAASQGAAMMYSSGTTGFPKGIRPPQATVGPEQPPPLLDLLGRLYGFDGSTVYLSPAPLYHAAPLKFNLAVHTLGGTTIIMEKFDAESALKYIQTYRVTHSQWVPTMFTRMLRLPEAVRGKYDLSSLRVAVHAAAPCPPEVKRAMLAWWGPVIYEYYAGSESVGMTQIGPQEWLDHPGSVGRACKGEIHVLDPDQKEVPPGEIGLIYFGNGPDFVYHKDPEKTARSRLANGWSTFGDIGYVDADGYLYLTDRRDYVIISGGVNIYPQEAENLLQHHPEVTDVAVFGIPNAEYGEEVKAVVQPVHPERAGPALEQELIAYCKASLASFKCPKSIDFVSDMPREPTGKLLKRLLQQRYRDAAPTNS